MINVWISASYSLGGMVRGQGLWCAPMCMDYDMYSADCQKCSYCYGALIDGYTSSGDATNLSYKRTTALNRLTGDTFFTEVPQAPIKYNTNTKPISVSGGAQFVRDNGKFLAELVKDGTGTIIGISFTQQSA